MPTATPFQLGPVGSSGSAATPFSDNPPAGAQIVSIQVYQGSVIYGIGITFANSEPPVFHGSNTKGTAVTFTLGQGEFLTGISGSYDNYDIDTLVLQTNQRVSPTYGGNNGADPAVADFMINVPYNCSFNGFCGRANSSGILALGLMVVQQGTPATPAQPCVCYGPSGGDGGDPFGDPLLPTGAAVSQIQVAFDSHVNGIAVSYVSQGITTNLPPHGDLGNNPSSMVLSSGEAITGISGTYDRAPKTLTVTTNLQTKAFGTANRYDVSFSYTFPPGVQFRGLLGRASTKVYALGAVGSSGSLPTASPVYRYCNNAGAYWYGLASATPPSGFDEQPNIFYGFSQQLLATTPVYQSVNPAGGYTYSLTQSSGSQIAWYAFPNPTSDPDQSHPRRRPAATLHKFRRCRLLHDQYGSRVVQGFSYVDNVGYVFSQPVPIYSYYNGTFHIFTSDLNQNIPFGYKYEMIRFYAFVQPVFGTLPVSRYINADGAYCYTPSQESLPGGVSGWSLDSAGVWYAYPTSAPGAASTQLYHFQDSSSGDQFYSLSSQTPTNYTPVNDGVWSTCVFSEQSGAISIAIPNSIILCADGSVYSQFFVDSDVQTQSTPDFVAKAYWYAFSLQVSHSALETILEYGPGGGSLITSLAGILARFSRRGPSAQLPLLLPRLLWPGFRLVPHLESSG